MTEIAPIAVSSEQLMNLVAHHSGTVSGILSPELAALLKTLNAGNRPLSEGGAVRFEQIANSGAWLNTGEPIVISSDGRLIDGQHRIEGVIRSGCSVVVDVRFGADPKAFQAMGTGARRTAAHALSILGETFGTTQAGIAKLLYLHDNKLFGQIRGGVETPIIVQTVRDNPNIAVVGQAIQASKFKPVRSSGFGFPLVLAARVASMEKVAEFIELVSTGLSDSPVRPARMLHQRLLDAMSKRERLDQMAVSTITARSWNAWAEDRDVKSLKVQQTDRSGQYFPKIVGIPA